MSTKSETTIEYRFDGLKWLLLLVLVLVAVVGNSLVTEGTNLQWVWRKIIEAGLVAQPVVLPLLYRILILLGLGLVACLIAGQTAKGAALWALVRESFVEVRKVVWPTPQETNQTTLIVLVVVFITSLILWALDTFFGWLASLIIG